MPFKTTLKWVYIKYKNKELDVEGVCGVGSQHTTKVEKSGPFYIAPF